MRLSAYLQYGIIFLSLIENGKIYRLRSRLERDVVQLHRFLLPFVRGCCRRLPWRRVLAGQVDTRRLLRCWYRKPALPASQQTGQARLASLRAAAAVVVRPCRVTAAAAAAVVLLVGIVQLRLIESNVSRGCQWMSLCSVRTTSLPISFFLRFNDFAVFLFFFSRYWFVCLTGMIEQMLGCVSPELFQFVDAKCVQDK